MQLVESGKMSLDDDVNDILGMDIRNPRYPDIPVTLRQVMTHTASLNDDYHYAKAVREVRAFHKAHPEDFRACREESSPSR